MAQWFRVWALNTDSWDSIWAAVHSIRTRSYWALNKQVGVGLKHGLQASLFHTHWAPTHFIVLHVFFCLGFQFNRSIYRVKIKATRKRRKIKKVNLLPRFNLISRPSINLLRSHPIVAQNFDNFFLPVQSTINKRKKKKEVGHELD